MFDKGTLDLDQKIGAYLPLEEYDKGDLIIRDILSHQARLYPWIPFYKNTLDDQQLLIDSLYDTQYSLNYKWPVAKDLYLETDYQNKIFHKILF